MIARPVASKVICSAIGSPCEPPLAGAPHIARTRARLAAHRPAAILIPPISSCFAAPLA